MNFSNKLDLSKFFKEFEDEQYCIIKLDKNFPNYYEYSDIDIFCYDVLKLADKIFKNGQNYIDRGFEIKATEVCLNTQVHIDFFIGGKLDFRFDLYQNIPDYKKILIKPAFYSSVIENRTAVQKQSETEFFKIYVPCKTDELILRYIEFVEYYDIRADKIKHANYINSYANKLDKKKFLDKLHFYTAIPEAKCDEKKINKTFIENSKF